MERKWWEEGREALRIGLQTLIEKGFFTHFCRTHAVTGWCLNGVNTQEAYRETQTGLGIVMCKLQHCRGGLFVWGTITAFISKHIPPVYEICIWTYISSCYQALHSCSNMLLYAVLACRGASVQYIVPAVPLLLFFPYSCRLYLSSFVFLLTTLLSSPKKVLIRWSQSFLSRSNFRIPSSLGDLQLYIVLYSYLFSVLTPVVFILLSSFFPSHLFSSRWKQLDYSNHSLSLSRCHFCS